MIEKIVVLNVDKRYEEFDRIKNDLINRYYKGKIERFLVGKGNIRPKEEYGRIDEERTSDLWHRGAFANLPNSYHAFKSFQAIISKALVDGNNNVLILEDDAKFTNIDDFTETFNNAIEQIQGTECDLLYLGANHTWAKTKEINKNLLKLNGSVCWHAVWINKPLFKNILTWTADRPIDLKAAQSLHDEYNCFAVWPTIITQKPGFSEVEQKYRDYSEFWNNKGMNW